jgi:regulator of cell morphogenesis and NO signaling
MHDVTPNQKVGALAARVTGAASVFHRHGIDFCCAGARTLAEACAAAGVPAEAVVADIEGYSGDGDDATGWEGRSNDELIDHILSRYHRPLDEQLPQLDGWAQKVFRVHGDKDPERLSTLADTVASLRAELEAHMIKEEEILFPWIRSGRGASAGGPIAVMIQEHEDAGQLLEEIVELTDGFQPPPGACATWRALWLGLEVMDRDLRRHIHLENNILFPRALAS